MVAKKIALASFARRGGDGEGYVDRVDGMQELARVEGLGAQLLRTQTFHPRSGIQQGN